MSQKEVEKMVENLTLKGCSQITIKKYKYAVDRFIKYHVGKELRKLKEDDILNYLKDLFISKSASAATYNFNLSVIIYFYSLIYNKTFNKVRLPHCKLRRKIPNLISNETIKKIIKEETNLKYKAWLCLAFGSGLREIEIATFKLENMFIKENKLKVLGKGNKERYTVLPNYTIGILKKYYHSKKMTKMQGYLFEGTKNNHYMSSAYIINYFLSVKKKYNLPDDFTFHSLRHAFATNFLEHGGNIMQLKSLLGHSSITSTAIYLHMSSNYKDLYSPLGGSK
jgi:site-specific recombinase XerD